MGDVNQGIQQEYWVKATKALRDYSIALFRFLQGRCRKLLKEGEASFLEHKQAEVLRYLKERYVTRIDKNISEDSPIGDAEAHRLLKAMLVEALKAPRKQKIVLPAKGVRSMIRKIRTQLHQQRQLIFAELSLTPSEHRLLDEILEHSVRREFFSPLWSSGIVIAGFGSAEHYPSILHYQIEGVFGGKVKSLQIAHNRVSHTDPVFIMPFAQDEMVRTFMEGIDPGLLGRISSYLERVITHLPLLILDHLKSSGARVGKSARANVKKVSRSILRDLEDNLSEYRHRHHADPVVEMTSNLPKDELAAMAEALVNLTSFKRRVSLDSETVGGPIDVAVISKGDGFIWIKRKHYFKPELNPDFFAAYQRTTSP